MRNDSLNLPFASSLLIHLIVLALGSALVQSNLRRQEFLPIALVDLPPSVHPAQAKKVEAPSETKKAPPLKQEKIKDTKSPAKTEIVKPEKAVPAPAAVRKMRSRNPWRQNRSRRREWKHQAFRPRQGSKAAAAKPAQEALFGKGDVGVVPGSGTAGGGGGTAASGLGRGSGAPGLPVQQTILRTNREAKPLQTVRAIYPAMALRAGLESDVTLRIEVDPGAMSPRRKSSKAAAVASMKKRSKR